MRVVHVFFDWPVSKKCIDQIVDISTIATRECNPFLPKLAQPMPFIGLLRKPTENVNGGCHTAIGNDNSHAATNLLLDAAASSEAHNRKPESHGLQDNSREGIFPGR